MSNLQLPWKGVYKITSTHGSVYPKSPLIPSWLWGKKHLGIDVALPIGTEVYSPFSGWAYAVNDGGIGVIVEDEKYKARLWHLSKVFVPYGYINRVQVTEGRLVGLSGDTA